MLTAIALLVAGCIAIAIIEWGVAALLDFIKRNF